FAIDDVVTLPAMGAVIAGAAVDQIIVIAAIQDIIGLIAMKRVVADPAVDRIVVFSAGEKVVSAIADKRVISRRAAAGASAIAAAKGIVAQPAQDINTNAAGDGHAVVAVIGQDFDARIGCGVVAGGLAVDGEQERLILQVVQGNRVVARGAMDGQNVS